MKKEGTRRIDCAATGGRICYYAMLFGYGPKELGRMTGCSEGAVRRWLKGANIPSPKYLKRLTEVFDIYPEDLLRYEKGAFGK